MSKNISVPKSWVIVKFNDNSIKVWTDYDDGYAWGSVLYEVLDYFDGNYKEALKHSLKINKIIAELNTSTTKEKN